ncbi:hypothetical protein [Cryptosporidium hominis TU502]|nr:hypothetical protein [Cryptosporidium hominis TU502]
MNEGANQTMNNSNGSDINTGINKSQKKLFNIKNSSNESDNNLGSLGKAGGGTGIEIDMLAKELLKNNNNREDLVMPYGGQLVQMNRKTFTIYCIISELDEKVVFKTRVTFQIVPRTRTQKS